MQAQHTNLEINAENYIADRTLRFERATETFRRDATLAMQEQLRAQEMQAKDYQNRTFEKELILHRQVEDAKEERVSRIDHATSVMLFDICKLTSPATDLLLLLLAVDPRQACFLGALDHAAGSHSRCK